jgi:dTDP-4-dehydrorhamnose reductase
VRRLLAISSSFIISPQDEIPCGIYQWCGSEPMTKYDMVQTMGRKFDMDCSHIQGVKGPSPGAPRPFDTTMDTSRLTAMGIKHHTPFPAGIKSALLKWKELE